MYPFSKCLSLKYQTSKHLESKLRQLHDLLQGRVFQKHLQIEMTDEEAKQEKMKLSEEYMSLLFGSGLFLACFRDFDCLKPKNTET